MLDRRNVPRERVIMEPPSRAATRTQRSICIVRNLSGGGANIELSNSQAIPENISIAIPKTGRSFLAKIVWWRANRAGVEFHSATADGHSTHSLDLEERLRISEKKARALKQRVRQLLGES